MLLKCFEIYGWRVLYKFSTLWCMPEHLKTMAIVSYKYWVGNFPQLIHVFCSSPIPTQALAQSGPPWQEPLASTFGH